MIVLSIDYKDKGSLQKINLYDIVSLIKDKRFFIFIISIVFGNIAMGPRKMKTSAMSFFGVACGLGGFVGNISCGILLEKINIFAVYKLISLMCLISIGFVFLLKNVDSRKTIKNK